MPEGMDQRMTNTAAMSQYDTLQLDTFTTVLQSSHHP
jgi:hypothetical protein